MKIKLIFRVYTRSVRQGPINKLTRHDERSAASVPDTEVHSSTGKDVEYWRDLGRPRHSSWPFPFGTLEFAGGVHHASLHMTKRRTFPHSTGQEGYRSQGERDELASVGISVRKGPLAGSEVPHMSPPLSTEIAAFDRSQRQAASCHFPCCPRPTNDVGIRLLEIISKQAFGSCRTWAGGPVLRPRVECLSCIRVGHRFPGDVAGIVGSAVWRFQSAQRDCENVGGTPGPPCTCR